MRDTAISLRATMRAKVALSWRSRTLRHHQGPARRKEESFQERSLHASMHEKSATTVKLRLHAHLID